MNRLLSSSASSIYDVARRTGVSTATVSMVINSKGKISEKTRRRVLAACEKLHYRPHPTARFLPRLRRGNRDSIRTGLFGFTPVMAPDETLTYSTFLDGLADAGVRRNKMIIYQPFRKGGEATALASANFSMDARILIGRVDDSVIGLFRSSNAPLVVAGDHQCQAPVWNVTHDSRAAARMAVQHLWERGHRRMILFCQAKPSGYQDEFRGGFIEALEANGIPRDQCEVIGKDPSGDEIVEVLRRSSRRPTGIVCVEGGRVRHVLRKSRELGLSVPRDFSLLGFGAIREPQAGIMVTYVDPMHEEIGSRSMDLAINLAENGMNGTPSRMLVRPRLVEGETSASNGNRNMLNNPEKT